MTNEDWSSVLRMPYADAALGRLFRLDPRLGVRGALWVRLRTMHSEDTLLSQENLDRIALVRMALRWDGQPAAGLQLEVEHWMGEARMKRIFYALYPVGASNELVDVAALAPMLFGLLHNSLSDRPSHGSLSEITREVMMEFRDRVQKTITTRMHTLYPSYSAGATSSYRSSQRREVARLVRAVRSVRA